MKKILSLVLVFVIFISACSSETEELNSDEKVEITILQNKVEIIEPLEELAETYNQQQDDVIVTINGFSGDVMQQLSTDLGTSAAPTIFSSNGTTEVDLLSEYISPITDSELLNETMEGATDLVTRDGEVYGYPFTMEGLGYIYNKDIFEEVGLTVEDFSTTEKFSDSCKKLDDSGYQCMGIAPEGYFISAHLMNTPLSISSNPSEAIASYVDGSVKLSEEDVWIEWADQLEAFKDYMPDVLNYSYDQQINDFANENTAIIHQGGWSQPLFDDYDIDFSYGFMPMQLQNNQSLGVGVTNFWHVNSDATDEQKDAADDFMTWLLTSDEAKEVIISDFGTIPPYNTFKFEDFSDLNAEIFQYANDDNILPLGFNAMPTGIVDSMQKPTMEKYFSGNIDKDEMLKEIEESFINSN